MMADKKQVNKYLKTVKSQVDCLLKMVEEDRQCTEISNQLLASIALLKKTNRMILESHINTCIQESLQNGNSEKVAEVLDLLEKLNK